MFDVFQNDRSSNRPWRRRDTLAASVGVHGLLLLGAANVPVGTGPGPGSLLEETVTFLEVLARQQSPAVVAGGPVVPAGPGPGPAEAAGHPPPARTAGAGAPEPARVALPSLTPSLEVAGGFLPAGAGDLPLKLAAGTAGGSGDRSDGGVGSPVDVTLLAERPVIRNRREMERVWRDLYPGTLRHASVEGETVVSFVIGTDGRVDPVTIRLIRASHSQFGPPSVKGARKLRFRPARLGGQAVRVRVELPILWRLQELA